MTVDIKDIFRKTLPRVDFCSLRLVTALDESLFMRQGILQPPATHSTNGVFITIYDKDGFGYAATSNTSHRGVQQAMRRAHEWARASQGRCVVNAKNLPRPAADGRYETPQDTPWESLSLEAKLTLLHDTSVQLKRSDQIVDWQSALHRNKTELLLLTSDGIEITQTLHTLRSGVLVVASDGVHTQERSGCGWGYGAQGGLEQLKRFNFPGGAGEVAEQALELLKAPDCPSGTMDLLLMPSQMVLQIHESIGHPLELDRILGDERNYAGRSFVTLDMFGTYQYGSKLLNVTFDPSIPYQLASYGIDDQGTKAERVYLIRDGLLQRPLGGADSQVRASMPGTANARATSWNRPPIDRMANINLEPGTSTFSGLVASIERGVLMDANSAWSIDDSRNKFQFGCEYGQLIEKGELKGLVRNPNYRGISATFWRNLDKVGDRSTCEVLGTPYCGKGEPNQVITVGHASPACVFRNVDVFGGM